MRYASVAQLVEQGTENPRVVGSIPTGGTIYADLAHLVERRLAKAKVAGSSPVIRSKHGYENSYPFIILYYPSPSGWGTDFIWRRSQAVRQRSAKPLFPGPIPGGASNERSNPIGLLFLFVGGVTPSSSRALPLQAAESGSHSPPEDRGACSPGVERANIRTKREIPETWRRSYNSSLPSCFLPQSVL